MLGNLKKYFDAFMYVINNISTYVLKFLHDFQIQRILLLVWLAWLTTTTAQWAMVYAASSTSSDLVTSTNIGAVLAPVTILQGYVLKYFSENKYQYPTKEDLSNGD